MQYAISDVLHIGRRSKSTRFGGTLDVKNLKPEHPRMSDLPTQCNQPLTLNCLEHKRGEERKKKEKQKQK